jgi:SAM-dependent methyltransferase
MYGSRVSELEMVGWDFSNLDGRMWAAEPPWDFEVMCSAAIRDASRVLDLGTGGGERLIRLLESATRPWPRVIATEGWAPNVPVATANLQPLGVEVIAYDPEIDTRMVCPDESFDLVMNRHEALDAKEIARVLQPGGILLTQQVDGNELPELRELFGGQPAYPDVTLAIQRGHMEEAGLQVLAADEWSGPLTFCNAEALDDYLSLVPWDRHPAFDVTQLPDGEVTLTQRRFWLQATR